MSEKTHRVIEIEYTGKVKDTGAVFDTTSKEVALKEKTFNPQYLYTPAVVVVGEGNVIKGLDSLLAGMKKGESKHVVLESKDAFGERDPSKVILTPLEEFKKNNIMPFPGLVIEADGMPARVQSVSGGRVRLDFNSELAGKVVEYDVRVVEEHSTLEAKYTALFKRSFPYAKIEEQKFSLNGKELTVDLSEDVSKKRAVQLSKQMYSHEVKKFLPEITEVRFVEKFTDPKEGQKAEEREGHEHDDHEHHGHDHSHEGHEHDHAGHAHKH